MVYFHKIFILGFIHSIVFAQSNPNTQVIQNSTTVAPLASEPSTEELAKEHKPQANVPQIGPQGLSVVVDLSRQLIYLRSPEIQAGQNIQINSRVGQPNIVRETPDSEEFRDESRYVQKEFALAKKVVRAEDGQIYYVSKISSGGGLKQPTNLLKKPYCASTPHFNGFLQAQGNLNRLHISSTYKDALMPWTMWIKGGVAFHEVSPTYKNQLGENISGDCIRLPKETAELLTALTTRHGGAQVFITGQGPNHLDCQLTPELIAERKALRDRCLKVGFNEKCYMEKLLAAEGGNAPRTESPQQASNPAARRASEKRQKDLYDSVFGRH